MSALRDILEKMYVEDELLNQLDDEQKQILFIKMREEQIRRWKQHEAEAEEREKQQPPKPRDTRRIQWLTGRDGEVWVWVMGDHPADPSIDDIIEDEARVKARQLAEMELANDRNVTAGAVPTHPPKALHPSISAREEQLKQELRNMRIGGSSSSSFEDNSFSKASSSDDGYKRPGAQYENGYKSQVRYEDSPQHNRKIHSQGDVPYYSQLRRSPPEGIELEDGRRLYIKPTNNILENTVREQFNGSPFRKEAENKLSGTTIVYDRGSDNDDIPPSPRLAEEYGDKRKPNGILNLNNTRARSSPLKDVEQKSTIPLWNREKSSSIDPDTGRQSDEIIRDQRRPSWNTNGSTGGNVVQRFLDEHDPKRRAARDKSPVKLNRSTEESPRRSNSREASPRRRLGSKSRSKSPLKPLRSTESNNMTSVDSESSKNSSPVPTPRQNSRESPFETEKKTSFLVGKFNSRQAKSPPKQLNDQRDDKKHKDLVKDTKRHKEAKEKSPLKASPPCETKDSEGTPTLKRFLNNAGCMPRLRRDSDDKYYASDENVARRSSPPGKKDQVRPVKEQKVPETNGNDFKFFKNKVAELPEDVVTTEKTKERTSERNSNEAAVDKIRINGQNTPLHNDILKKNGPPPPVPEKPSFLKKKADGKPGETVGKDFVQSTRSYVPGHNPTVTFTPQQVTSPSAGLKPNRNESPVDPVLKTTPTKPKDPSPASSTDGSSSLSPEMQRLRDAQQRLEELLPPQDELEKRQSVILEKLMEEHQRLKEEAEREAERERLAYEDQKRKSKEAEAQIRAIAQKAREQHEKNLRTSTALLPMLHKTQSEDARAQNLRDVVKNMPRPPKPKNREEIIDWFKRQEQSNGAGIDPWTKRPFVWFHGIISRSEADNLLANQPPGAFIVRISERIWGYTVSYVVGGPELKHFLVERIPEGYQFLGTNQVVHKTLQDLVDYHETKPITSKGQECLLYPVGQQDPNSPDYANLFDQLPMASGGYNNGGLLSSRFFQSSPSLTVHR